MLTERDIKVGKQLLGLSGIDDWKSFCKNYLFFFHMHEREIYTLNEQESFALCWLKVDLA